MQIKDEIWVLADSRPGNYSQAIGLASEIGFEYRIINISYGIFSFLPNIILRDSWLGIDKKTKKKLREFSYFPKLIISAGRRSAPVLLHLKKLSQNRTKIVQIMNPEMRHQDFDFIILPRHDAVDAANVEGHENIIQTIGSLTKINDSAINLEKERFAQWFANIKKPKIALFVGGASKNTNFSADFAKKLAKQASEIAKNMKATLLVLNSRRSGDELTNALKSSLSGDFKFFDWKKIRADENPYLAIVGYGDFFIVTADSVSMISEVCSTGKPVYIFDEKSIATPKHRRFQRDLLQANYVKKIEKTTDFLENFAPKKLSETKRVAKIILEKIYI